MYVIFSINKIRAEHLDQFLREVKVHAKNSNGEAGCLRYDVLQDVDDPQTVCLHEVFLDEARFAQHQAASYYKEWMERSKNWRHSERCIRHVLNHISRTEDA